MTFRKPAVATNPSRLRAAAQDKCVLAQVGSEAGPGRAGQCRSDLKASPPVVRLLSPLPEMPLPSAVLLLSLCTCHLSFREDGFQLSSWAGRTITDNGGSLWATTTSGLCYSSDLKTPTSSCLGSRTVLGRSYSARLPFSYSPLHCVPQRGTQSCPKHVFAL